MTDQKAAISGDDIHTRIAATQVRIKRLETVETKLRKLNIALANIAVAERKTQLGLLKSACKFVDGIKAEPVQGMGSHLRILKNELISFDEGIRANIARPQELVLTSGVSAQKEATALIAAAKERLTKLQAASMGEETDNSELEINQAREELNKIPAFGDKDFIVHRAAVAFSGANSGDSKFSKVGYISVEALDKLGFKAGTIGGYTVVKKQLCIGINPLSLMKTVIHPETKEETRVPVTVKVTKQVNKAGKPTQVVTKRPKTPLDAAKKVVKLLQEQTGTQYEFLTQTPCSFKKGTWFWVMPTADLRRFARAFPGGRVEIRTWGLAGEQTASPQPKKEFHVPPNRREGYDPNKRY